MDKKKLMILGASILQLPAIIKAKEKDLHVIVVDMNKNAIGVSYADEFLEISTTDVENIVRRADELKIDGIMTLATDMPMRAVAAVGEKLGLNTISSSTAKIATNKALMRESLLKFHVPIPKFYYTDNYLEFKEIIDSFDGDVIAKPADSSGSRGVYLLDDRRNIKKAFDYSKSYSKSGEVVIEEYMTGKEVSVETITVNSSTYVVAITDKKTSGPPYFVEIGHSIPSKLTEEIKSKIKKVAVEGVNALGINNSASHVEIIVTEDGPKIVEIGSRLGGDNITSHLVPLATGVDMIDLCIDLAMNNKIYPKQKFDRGSAISYILPQNEIVFSEEKIKVAKMLSGIKDIQIFRDNINKISEIHNSTERLGYVISCESNVDKAISIINKAREILLKK